MVAVKSHRIKASSLIEVTVAMVIILMVFSLALMTYFNITNSGVTLQKLRYRLLLSDYAGRTKREKSFIDEKIEIDGATIEKKVLPYGSHVHLLLLEINIQNEKGQIVTRQKEVIYQPDEKD